MKPIRKALANASSRASAGASERGPTGEEKQMLGPLPPIPTPRSAQTVAERARTIRHREKKPEVAAWQNTRAPSAWFVIKRASIGLLLFSSPIAKAARRDPEDAPALVPIDAKLDQPHAQRTAERTPRELILERRILAARNAVPDQKTESPFAATSARAKALIAAQLTHEADEATRTEKSAKTRATAFPKPSPTPKLGPKLVRFADLTPTQRMKLRRDLARYVTPEILRAHTAWHEKNGPGGTLGPGSGAAFIQMHERMLENAEAALRLRGWGKEMVLPDWGASTDIPMEMRVPKPTRFTRANTQPRVTMPPWLTAQGVGDAKTWGKKDPSFGRSKLADFTSEDELGQAIGLYYHAEGHIAVGGTMATFNSPLDPMFWGWHKHIQNIVEQYRAIRAKTHPGG